GAVGGALIGVGLEGLRWVSHVVTSKPGRLMGAVLRRIGRRQPPLRRVAAVVRTLASVPRLMNGPAEFCEVGQALAAQLGFGPRILRALGQVFERWDGKGAPARLKRDQTDRAMRVVQVARDVELFHRVAGAEAVVAMVRERAG